MRKSAANCSLGTVDSEATSRACTIGGSPPPLGGMTTARPARCERAGTHPGGSSSPHSSKNLSCGHASHVASSVCALAVVRVSAPSAIVSAAVAPRHVSQSADATSSARAGSGAPTARRPLQLSHADLHAPPGRHRVQRPLVLDAQRGDALDEVPLQLRVEHAPMPIDVEGVGGLEGGAELAAAALHHALELRQREPAQLHTRRVDGRIHVGGRHDAIIIRAAPPPCAPMYGKAWSSFRSGPGRAATGRVSKWAETEAWTCTGSTPPGSSPPAAMTRQECVGRLGEANHKGRVLRAEDGLVGLRALDAHGADVRQHRLQRLLVELEEAARAAEKVASKRIDKSIVLCEWHKRSCDVWCRREKRVVVGSHPGARKGFRPS